MVRGRRMSMDVSMSMADLRELAQQEEECDITPEDIEKSLIPASLKAHKYVLKLWKE
jgi:hypothetical protein